MSLLRTAAPIAITALALGLAACGGKSDSDQVKEVATQIATANPKVCDNVTAKFLKNVGGTKAQCKKSAKASKAKDAKVGKVKVDGKKATAVLSQGTSKVTLQLIKDSSDWKVDGAK
ncbi:MAG: hypothetical protein ACR2HC_06650 [Thermoleophilaceae bacterium]